MIELGGASSLLLVLCSITILLKFVLQAISDCRASERISDSEQNVVQRPSNARAHMVGCNL